MPQDHHLVFKKHISAPADLIYRAFTSASALREWLCDVSTTNPNEGGRIYLAWHRGYFASGYFTRLVPDQAISFSWIGKDDPAWTQVNILIHPTEINQEFLVELQHLGVGSDPAWDSTRDEITQGWELGMENLKSTLENGKDLRMVNRPLIGIYPEDLGLLTKEARDKLAIPVDYGVVVSGIVPEYGAEQAGMQLNDVIVAIGGKRVENIKTLGVMMNEFSPGDQIKIDVYRGPEKMGFDVATKVQSVAVLPDSLEELAKELETASSKVLDTLEGILENITEAEAAFSPGSEEWSVKEVLVHLIHNEREIHSWINGLYADQEGFHDEWPGDNLFRIRATLAAHPTVDDLLTELRLSLKETVASVAFLDQEFARRKQSYWRLGTELLGAPKHIMEHIQQIEDNIIAARGARSH